MLSPSAQAGSISYAPATLRYAIGDGETAKHAL